MKKNWKNEREELINFLYKQNAQIMDDRENLLGDMFACQAFVFLRQFTPTLPKNHRKFAS